jgi:fido (protein-threonine AMPylation protein)
MMRSTIPIPTKIPQFLRTSSTFGIRANSTIFEAEISNARAGKPLPDGNLDFAHFCAVRHHLFQDVCEWAGKARTVRISKLGSAFCFPEHIDAQAAKPFSDLEAADFFDHLPGDPGRSEWTSLILAAWEGYF